MEAEKPKNLKSKRRQLLLAALVLVIAGLIIGLLLIYSSRKSNSQLLANPLSKRTMSQLDFSLYYPNPTKLPSGFYVDMKSFTASQLAIVYSVKYDNGSKYLAFSVQKKPPANQLNNFYNNQLSLHDNINTSVGTAAIGIIGSQTIVSLPTNGDSWLIVTAPENISNTNLKQVMKSVEQASY